MGCCRSDTGDPYYQPLQKIQEMIPSKQAKRYRHANGGDYEGTYIEPTREPSGIPQLPDSNLVNLERRHGRIDAPVFIVTTMNDFKQSFKETRVVDLDDDTTAPELPDYEE